MSQSDGAARDPRTAIPVVVRAATAGDVQAVGRIWRQGWQDGHHGHVPAELIRAREAESFTDRARQRLSDMYVAEDGSVVAGFVVVLRDEVEQLYVNRGHRGTGAARTLLTHGESIIRAAGFAGAWLAVASGNSRAQRFYARQGWCDQGSIEYRAATESGDVLVPCRRYVRALLAPDAGATANGHRPPIAPT